MELILIAIFALVVLGSVDKKLYPRTQTRRSRTVSRRVPQRRKKAARRAQYPRRHSTAQVSPVRSLSGSHRR